MTEIDVAYLDSNNWDDSMPARMRWLRDHDPVHWSEKDQCWLLSRYEEVAFVSKNQELFTSAHGVRPGVKIGLIDEGQPRHGRLRGLINKGFTPRMVKKLEAAFREITRESIDSVARSGSCDFVEAIAAPLPLLLIAEMIGIRREDRADFHRWSDDMIAGDGNLHRPEIVAKAGAAFLEYSRYVIGIIEDRRANPRDDLVSILVGAKDAGMLQENFGGAVPVDASDEHMQLANDELIMLMVILLVAGNETTRNAISGGLQLLIEHPAEREKLMRDPALLPSAVEEMVRVVSPVHSFARTTTADTELCGRPIAAGQRVLLLYPSANRDETVFEDPDAFRIERNPLHLGFGLGPHFCLGANLARMEMRVAFEEILRRLPDIDYAPGARPVMKPSALVRSCMEMRVRFTPEA